MSLVKFAAIFVAASTVSQLPSQSFSQSTVLAQAFGENPDTFSIPESLPDGVTLKVDGSTSMRVTNEALESRFEEQYGNVDVELAVSRTDEAFDALIDGDIDVLATGRPLTDEEKSQGVVEVPLEQREKLAIIVGPDNEFAGDLSFAQFAAIFRGEITNWSDIGGPDLAIRFVDRPDYSDTRRALSTYKVFEGTPFETGSTAAPVAEDETESVIQALGNDGIGYSVVSQVQDRDDVRILPMHQTLPDDPRYPYSQYRAFVYKEGASPAALAFLGFATTEPGQEVIATGVAAAPTNVPAAEETPPAAAAPDPATTDDSDPAVADAPDSAVTDALDPAVTDAPDPETAAGAAAAQDKGGFPLWLLPLLAIPFLGGLLWWLLRGAKGATPAAAPVAAGAAAAPVAAAAPARLVLTPRDCRNAYAYWEIPQERLNEVKHQGGETMMVRIYDVTGRSKTSPLPSPAGEFPCIEANPDLHLPITVDDRSYCAEVGYMTRDNEWLPMAKSEQVRVPVCPPDAVNPVKATPSVDTSPLKSAGGAALGGAALAGAAALGASKLTGGGKAKKTPVPSGKLTLDRRSPQAVYATWEIPQERLADAKLQGGETMVAKLYDVTDRPAEAILPEPVSQKTCTGVDGETQFDVSPERDYLAEVGYETKSGGWLPLAASDTLAGAAAKFPPGAAVVGGAAAVAAGAAAVGIGDAKKPLLQSRIVLTPQSSQKAYANWDVPETAKSALKAEGGQDYQLRIHDVTDLDINQQAPNSTLTYEVSELDCDRTVPLPNAQSDYLAEIGYQTEAGDWLMVARSAPVKPATVLEDLEEANASLEDLEEVNTSQPFAKGDGDDGVNDDEGNGGAAMLGLAAVGGGLAAASIGQKSVDSSADTVPTVPQGQIVKVHSRNNALMFNEEQLHHIEHAVANTHSLTPAVYTLQIKDGVFNYDGDDTHPGEPFVLLWIHGGTVINEKTGIPVSSTWTTLNGYDDTLTLDVREPAMLCAFFLDTYPDDNTGEITLSVTKRTV